MFLQRYENTRIYYDTWGEGTGPWVTLVNGYSRSSSDFRAMARFLVERGFRVLTFDNRGSGKTETPLDFSLQDIVDDVFALWDSLKVTRSFILGISYGGVVSLNVAHRSPNRVSGLALVSTSATSRYVHAGEQLYNMPMETVEAELAKYFSPAFAEANRVLFKALVKETAKAFSDPESRERTRAQRRALNNFDFTAYLPALRMPVLVAHGTADQVIDPAAAEDFRQGIPQAKVELFPGVGHLLLAETPKRFYEVVAGFFASPPRPS